MERLRSIRLAVFCKKVVIKNFAKFTGKHVLRSLFFNKVASLYDGAFFATIVNG